MSYFNFFFCGRFFYACPLYDNFLEMVSQINANKKAAQLQNKTQNKKEKPLNHKAQNQVLSILTLIIAYIIFGSTSFFFYAYLSPVARLAICDYFYLVNIPVIHRIWPILNCSLVGFWTYLFYFCNSKTVFLVLKRIYCLSKGANGIEGFFLTSNFHLFKRMNIAVVHFLQRQLLPVARLYIMAVSVLFTLFVLFFILVLHFKAKQLGLLQDASSTPAYLSFLCFALIWAIIAKLCMELMHMYAFHVILLSYVFHVRLVQTWTHLHEGKAEFFSELRLRLHLRYNADSLVFLGDFNRLYGRAMWILFLAIYPENATNWTVVMRFFANDHGHQHQRPYGAIPLWIRAIICCAAVAVLLLIKAIHYNAIGLTRRMFDCAAYMAGVAVHSRSFQRHPRTRLKLERYLDLFHSTLRPHSVTYGRHGNVSKASFGKSIFYYFKLLLFVNKLFN